MHTQLLQSRRVLRSSLAAAVSLMLAPAVVQAQTPAALYGIKTHKSAVVTVDYVDASRASFLKASQKIAPGQDHDARLLAVLVKDGAPDTKGPQVQCPDGSTAERGGIGFWVAKSGRGEDRIRLVRLGEATGVMPRFNLDGTVTVMLKLHQAETVPVDTQSEFGRFGDGKLPTSARGYLFTTRTFHEGETIMVGNSDVRSTAPTPIVHLTFVRVAISTELGEERKPDFSPPSGNSVVVTP